MTSGAHPELLEILLRRDLFAEVPGFAGYYASYSGHVFSLRQAGRPYRNGRKRLRMAWLRERCEVRADGYVTEHLKVNLYDGPRRRTFFVHQVIAMAWLGVQPSPSHEICHRDGWGDHNEVPNLRWLTHQQNMQEWARHRSEKRGQVSCLLEDDDVAYVPDPEFGF